MNTVIGKYFLLQFLRFFTSVPWGFLPTTNLVDCAIRHWFFLSTFFSIFLQLFSIYFTLASVFFKHLLLLVRILWYSSYPFSPLFYCFLYFLSVNFCASSWPCLYSFFWSVSCQFSAVYILLLFSFTLFLVLFSVSFPFLSLLLC